MSRGANFIDWLIEDVEQVTAEVGTPRDAQLREFEAQGFLSRKEYAGHGENNYAITGKYLNFVRHDA